MFCPSQIKDYIITGLVSNFFNTPCKRVTSSFQNRKHKKFAEKKSSEEIFFHISCLLKMSDMRFNPWSHNIHVHNIIGHYNPSVRIIDLVSHITYVVCVNFIHKWRDLLFKADSERQIFWIFWETFHGNFIYSQSFYQKSAERKSPKKYYSYFVLISGLGLEPWLFV